MFEIAMALLITHVSLCHMILQSLPVPYSVPISEFSFSNSKNRFVVAALFFTMIAHMTMCHHGKVWRETSESY